MQCLGQLSPGPARGLVPCHVARHGAPKSGLLLAGPACCMPPSQASTRHGPAPDELQQLQQTAWAASVRQLQRELPRQLAALQGKVQESRATYVTIAQEDKGQAFLTAFKELQYTLEDLGDHKAMAAFRRLDDNLDAYLRDINGDLHTACDTIDGLQEDWKEFRQQLQLYGWLLLTACYIAYSHHATPYP